MLSRLDDVEARLAFQEEALRQMSDEMALQQRTLERLNAQIQWLLKRQDELQAGQAVEGTEPPPPHY